MAGRMMWWGGAGRRRSNDDRDGNGLEIIMLVVSLLAIVLAPLAATLVQLAISRQREFLADASSVGTLIYMIATGFRVPVYLGSSSPLSQLCR